MLTPDGEEALVHVGDAVRLVDVETGAIVVDDVLVPGPFTDAESRQRGPIIALLAPNLVLHGGFPARGERQVLVVSSVAPGARFPIRVTDLAADRSWVFVPRTWSWAASYGPAVPERGSSANPARM